MGGAWALASRTSTSHYDGNPIFIAPRRAAAYHRVVTLARLPQPLAARLAALPPRRQELVQDLGLGVALAIVNEDEFDTSNLEKAGYHENPLADPALPSKYDLHKVPMTRLTRDAAYRARDPSSLLSSG